VLGGIVRGKLTTLRPPREDDLALVNAWMADPRVHRAGQLWDEPATTATWKERLKEVAKDHFAVLWTVDAASKPAGTVKIGIGHTDPIIWIAHFVLDPGIWGRGYGWDAALALHRYAFDYLTKTRAYLELAADNAAGLRIAARLGYREFGRGHDVYYRDGAYTDDVWLRFDRDTWQGRWASEREYAPFAAGIDR
jgi:RimJ/RimL family protein N-acetyltransferase